MAGGFGSLPSFANGDDQTALSPALQAWIQDQQLQAQYAPVATPPGFTGYNAPTAPAAADPGRVVQDNVRVPSLSSVTNGVMNGATGSVQDAWNAGPGFTQRFLTGQIDPRSEEAAAGGLGVAGLAMTGSMPFEVPAGALRMFGGKNAATADLGALAKAEEMHAGGAERGTIWDQTGWFKGPDDKWRFEIPDNASKLGTAAEDRFLDERPLQGKVAGNFWHKDLYDAYPDLRRLDVNVERAGDYTMPFSGAYNGSEIYGQASSIGDARQLMLHELQHAVQDAEGFAKGGDPARLADQMPDPAAMNDAAVMGSLIRRGADPDLVPLKFMEMLGRDPHPVARTLIREHTPDEIAAMPATPLDAYRRLVGEVEARNVQKRRDFTPEQRRATPPWETQDVPAAQQIVRLR
jgi:hypothetical protein